MFDFLVVLSHTDINKQGQILGYRGFSKPVAVTTGLIIESIILFYFESVVRCLSVSGRLFRTVNGVVMEV